MHLGIIMADVNNKCKGGQSFTMDNGNGNIFDRIKKTGATSDSEQMRECFDTFDVDQDGFLNRDEFGAMLESLFYRKARFHKLTEKQKHTMFTLLDENSDGQIDEMEFKVCWFHWLPQVLDPVSALVVVDVQNDFISGSLSISNCPARHNGAEVVPVINNLLNTCHFDLVVYTLDWHPKDHISFFENVQERKIHCSSKVKCEDAKTLDTVIFCGPPITEQILWPAHCVQDTWGAELHQDLNVLDNAVTILKGTNSDVDSYSAFWDNNKRSQTELVETLTRCGVTDVYVCGIAYDVCVGATATHAVEHGFRTVLIEDACRGVSDEGISDMRDKLVCLGAIISDAEEIADMVTVDDRRPELGCQAAQNVAMARRLLRDKSSSEKEKIHQIEQGQVEDKVQQTLF